MPEALSCSWEGKIFQWQQSHPQIHRAALLKHSRNSTSGGKRNTRRAPPYRIIPLNVAHSACEMSQNAQRISRLKAFPRLRLSRSSKFDCRREKSLPRSASSAPAPPYRLFQIPSTLNPSDADQNRQSMDFLLEGFQICLFQSDPFRSLPHLPQHGRVGLLESLGLRK
jgi:hypothetical protein